MIASADIVKRSLEMVKDAVQASMQSDRTREGVKVKDGAFDEDHDVPMYGEATKAQYPMQHEVKKRRGVSLNEGCHLAAKGANELIQDAAGSTSGTMSQLQPD